MRHLFTIFALGLLAGPSLAQGQDAPFTVQESGRGFNRLQEAVDSIGGGSGTIMIAPGRYRDCAVQNAGSVAFVAVRPGSATFDGGICEDKATLVLRGQSARVHGLVFQNLRVADQNGAGIRLEKGPLTVTETMFRDSESGILSSNDPSSEIRVERSTFSGLGFCGNDCAHSIYIGDYGKLTVVRSRFERGRGGHYVKSRSPRIEVVDSSFDDSEGRTTNYMIDLSNGGSGLIARNAFLQGPNKENYSALIMVAGEGPKNGSDLLVTGNEASLAPGFKHETTFVADGSGGRIRVENNRLAPRIARFVRR